MIGIKIVETRGGVVSIAVSRFQIESNWILISSDLELRCIVGITVPQWRIDDRWNLNY